MSQIQILSQHSPVPIRKLIVLACIGVFALLLLGGSLSFRAAAYDGKTNFCAGDPAVQTLVSGKNTCDSICVAENGELMLDGKRTHVWLGTGTTKQWLAGLTVGRDTIVAGDGQFQVYRDRKLVAQTDCALTGDGLDPNLYDRTITKYTSEYALPPEIEEFNIVYLYDFHTLWMWGTYYARLTKSSSDIAYADYFDGVWAFVFEDEGQDPNTVYDNVVGALSNGWSHILARNATIVGGDGDGFLGVRFFAATDENRPETGYSYVHYIDLRSLAKTHEHKWYNRYGDSGMQNWNAQGE